MFFIFVLLSFTALTQDTPQQCPSKWQLSNLIQTTKILQISSSADRIDQNFSEPFGATFFDSKPDIIISASDYQSPSFSDIDFSIIPNVNETILTLRFQSNGMKWNSLKVIVWLTARPDMIVGLVNTDDLNIRNLESQDITINTTQPVKFHSDPRTKYLNFITGMRGKSSSNFYEVNVTALEKSETTYSFRVSSTPQTNLQGVIIGYVIFNLQISLFSSGGGFETELNLLKPVYQKVHKNFVPINYKMLGFDRIKINKENSLNLHVDIDQDYILETESKTGINYIRVGYLTIGQKANLVCEECGNFIFQNKCIDSCPQLTYPFLGYISGGKSCLTCSLKMNQIINTGRTGCTCIQKYIRNTNGLCIEDISTNSVTEGENALTFGDLGNDCGVNKTLVNGQCVCDSESIALDGGVCFKCVPGSFKQEANCIPCVRSCIACSDDKSCSECIEGFAYNSNNNVCQNTSLSTATCSPLNNQTFNISTNNCQCLSTFVNISGFCQCPLDFIFNTEINLCQQTRIDSITVKSRVPLNHDLSLCLIDQVYDGSICIRCPNSTYPNNIQRICSPCIDRCTYCSDNTNCFNCIQGFSFNPSTLSCTTSNCRPNQIIINGQCNCNSISIRTAEGVCQQCPQSTFKLVNTCASCPSNCDLCEQQNQCLKCSTNFELNQGKTCDVQNPCGNSVLTSPEECDDGNNNNADGCSSDCKIQPGYTCIGNICKLILNLKSSKIISTGIITDFQTSEPISKQQLQNSFTVEILNKSHKPKLIKIFQPQNNPISIRVFLQYCLLPPDNIKVNYSLKKSNIQGTVKANYDPRTKKSEYQINNAIKEDDRLS